MPPLLPENAVRMRDELCDHFCRCCDLSVQVYPRPGGRPFYLACFVGFCDKSYLSEALLKPLTASSEESIGERLACVKVSPVMSFDEAVSSLLDAFALLFYDDDDGGLVVLRTEAKGVGGRAIAEPDGEVVVRGPREGFVESAEVNAALLRKRLKTDTFCVEKLTLGSLSRTTVLIVYLSGCADEETVSLVRERLKRAEMPSVMDSGYLEAYLDDKPRPLFPEVGNSEKPDKVAAKLCGGRVAVICDGSPCVLTVPYFFVECLQSAEDYLKTPWYASFVRALRLCGILIALFLPALYMALLEYNASAFPRELYRTIAENRRAIPFSAFTELTLILLTFELIREVGIRMPRAVGDAVSIVAGIILGDAAIKAGLASAPAIMVVALSAVSSFICPPYMNAIPLVRMLSLAAARLFGLFGLTVSAVLFGAVLCTKTSCRRPYLLPLSPLCPGGLSDTLPADPKKALTHNESEVTRV